MTGRVTVLFDGLCDVAVVAGCVPSCSQKLPVLSSVVDAAFGAAEVLGLDWTSSSGEMSSNGLFPEGSKGGPGFPSMVRDCSRERVS